jgi:hypothetical protein
LRGIGGEAARGCDFQSSSLEYIQQTTYTYLSAMYRP